MLFCWVNLSTQTAFSKKDSISGEEVNQFYTLLHTTLKLSNQDSPPQTPPDFDSGEPASTPEEQARRNKLSPVVELSESAVSTLTEEDGPKPSVCMSTLYYSIAIACNCGNGESMTFEVW